MMNSGTRFPIVLWIGPNDPRPAPESVTRYVEEIQITSDVNSGSTFQVKFRMNRSQRLDFDLLRDESLAPFSRMRVGILSGVVPTMLADGVITHQEPILTGAGGSADLTVMCTDLTLMLDLEDKAHRFDNQSDSTIAQLVLADYQHLGLFPEVTPTTETPSADQLVRQQPSCTDYAYLCALAKRNGFVFYTEPTSILGSTAYFGPEDRGDEPLPSLSYDMGGASNVNSLQLTHNAFMPGIAEATVIDPSTGNPVDVTAKTPTRQPLARNITPARRKVRIPGSAKQTLGLASAQAQALVDNSADTVTVQGQLDTLRYGSILRTHRQVGVRGGGDTFDGLYRVQSVTHSIRRDQYTQSFTLSRGGTGSTVQEVPT